MASPLFPDNYETGKRILSHLSRITWPSAVYTGTAIGGVVRQVSWHFTCTCHSIWASTFHSPKCRPLFSANKGTLENVSRSTRRRAGWEKLIRGKCCVIVAPCVCVCGSHFAAYSHNHSRWRCGRWRSGKTFSPSFAISQRWGYISSCFVDLGQWLL